MAPVHPSYPAELQVMGRAVLVVGGGPVALRKVDGLLVAGAAVTVVAPEVIPELANRPVRIVRRPYEPGEAAGYRLVVAATGVAAVDREVRHDADTAGVWVEVVSEPTLCTFTSPAVLRRGRVQVTVSTGGAAPAMAAWLRDRVAETVGEEVGEVAEVLAALRADLQASGISTSDYDWAGRIEAELAEARRRRAEAGTEPSASRT